jgi:Ca2+/Na+ antiporter
MDPGLIGGLLLPILGALPDSAMIVMSGMNGTVEEANKQVAVGIGTLAGSTVMLLSIAWGGSLWVGRCDIVRGHAVDKKLTKELDWIDSGVSTDTATRLNAYIMIASALLYLTPQIPTFMGYPHDPAAAGVGCILCLLALAAYCAFQVLYPELQKRQKDAAHKKMLRQHAVAMAHQVAKATGAMLIDSNGEIREDAMRALFERFDEDGSGKIDRDELRKMMQILSQANRTGAQQADLEADLEFMIKACPTPHPRT